MAKETEQLFRLALRLSIFTIMYNSLEGIISILMGAHDETLTLFGFGLDSIIEVISGVGIFIMIQRVWRSNGKNKSQGEILALKITGISFYVLTGLLITSSIMAIVTRHHPLTTFRGTVISVISMTVMLILARQKINTGRKLDSKAIISDGKCTMVCLYMSLILFVSSLLYQWTQLAYLDVLGCLGLSWFCYHEGKEALEGARNLESTGCC